MCYLRSLIIFYLFKFNNKDLFIYLNIYFDLKSTSPHFDDELFNKNESKLITAKNKLIKQYDQSQYIGILFLFS